MIMTMEKLKRLIDRYPIISFDIYDTLILRPYAKPVDLHIHMEQLFKCPHFAYNRLVGEQDARLRYSHLEDITFDSIYGEMAPQYARMQKLEVETEIKLAMANPEMAEVFEYAKKAGKRVILITDMYLPREAITATLEANGYTGYEKLYISSETGVMKHSGNLFRHAFRDLGVTPSEVLHIGDTPHSDIEGARSCGANTYYYPKVIERLYKKNPRTKVLQERNPISHGVSLILGILALSHPRSEKGYWWDFGYDYAGPAIFAFMAWLRREVKSKGIRKVLFVARDGYTPKKVFDLLCDGDNIESSYIYAPRNVTALTSFDYRQRNRHDPTAAFAMVEHIIAYYKERDPDLRAMAPKKLESAEQGMAFIDANKDRFAKLAAVKSADYGEYILPFLSDGRVALVDTLSIHLSSQKLVQRYARQKNCSIEGFYWALVENSFVDGCAVSAFQPERHWVTYDWDTFEFLMTAPEPSLKDFAGGKPVYLPLAEEEEYRTEVYPDVSDGAVTFAKDAIRALKGLDPFISNHDVTEWINILCTHPDEENREKVWRIKHMYDSNVNIFKPICKQWFTVVQTIDTYRLFKYLPVARVSRMNSVQRVSILGIFAYTRDDKEARFSIGGLTLYRKMRKRGVVSHYLFGIWRIYES